MINTKHVLKVTTVWMSIVWVVCYAGVALFPGIRPAFMLYGLHTATNFGEDILTLTTFLSGLVIWNLIVLLAVGLFAYLFNRMRA